MNKLTKILIAVLVVLTAGLTVIHLTTRETTPEKTILVRQAGRERTAAVSELKAARVSGTIVNGKGETAEIDAEGTALSSLAEGGFRIAKVTADDEYSAEVAAEEEGNAFLIVNEDGSVQLVVFGDSNSKRAVRNVVRVEFDD